MARSTPLVEDGVLRFQLENEADHITVDSLEWWRWLERDSVTTFHFKHAEGNFTARREQKSGSSYWYAYRKRQGHLAKVYLGKTEELLLAHLEQVALLLATTAQSHMAKEDPATVFFQQQQTFSASPAITPPPANLEKKFYSPLLMTKLYLPPTRSDLVVRSQLLQALDHSQQQKLTLLSAPAGFGKTTLLSMWLTRSQQRYAWLSLDKRDNDPGRFWLYIATTLQKIIPEIQEEVLPLLSTLALPPSEALLTLLLNILAEVRQNVILVLDDYHLITEQDIHEKLSFFLENLPATTHLLIASRSEPTFSLTRLRAQGQLSELHSNDLRFSNTEATAFLCEIMHLNLSKEEIKELDAHTEGWIAGLQLAALSMQGQTQVSDFIATFRGNHRYILDYLSSEVLQRQSEPIRDFLLHTAILERLSAPLCNAITGQNNGQAMLEELERINLFLIPLDEQRHWYRYHHLFAEFLQERLQQREPELLPQLHLRASQWYEQHQMFTEAITHALRADAMQRALQMVEDSAIEIMKNGEIVTLLQWIRAFPEEQIRKHMHLHIFKAAALTGVGQLEYAERCLQEVEQSLKKMQEEIKTEQEQLLYEERYTEFAACRAIQAAFCADLPATFAWSQYALEHLRTEEDFIRSIVATSLGSAYLLLGNLQAAYETYTTAITAAFSIQNVHTALADIGALGFIQAAYGHLQQAIETHQQAIRMSRNKAGYLFPVVSMSYASLAQIWYERNNLEEAQRYAQDGIKQGKRWGYSGTLAQCSCVLATIQVNAEQTAEAFTTMEELERLVEGNTISLVAGLIRSQKALLHLRTGNLERAVYWAQTCGLSEHDTITYPRDGEYLILTQILLAQGATLQARRFLERLISVTEADGRNWTLIDSLVQLALLEQAEGDLSAALNWLTKAVRLAASEGFVRVFLDKGEAILLLLRQLLWRANAPKYTKILLTAFGESPTGTTPQDREVLSERELHILRCIAEGRSNQEIAQELIIALSTVKTHLSNIYTKLEVHSRTQAIGRARESGLLL